MAVTWGRAAGLCVLAAVAFVAAGVAVEGYSMSGSSAIETPTRTVTYEGQSYTIDSVSRITGGESVTITASVPPEAAYNVNLRGPDNQLISSERKTGNATHTLSYFGPDDEAGTYVATIEDDGDTVAVHPIVVAGYDISVTPPDDVEAGEEATVTATVTERSGPKHSSLDRVEVVVGNDDVEAQQSMARVEGDTYETTVSTNGLAAETYNVYVVVRGNETVRGQAEILGVSDTVDLTVTEAATETASPTERTPTTPGGTATPAGETDTAHPATPAPGTDRDASSVSPGMASDAPTSSGPGNVIAPATGASPATSGGSGPGFTVAVALCAVLAAVALGRRR